ncbi:MAG: type I glyceraldehyde-3-phosphate dehydrogenase [Longimonas sp.]|uniref:type I glyceraldehyde-3-phosphate dehydrogenase n=1 Tax=Longimonas sp. TaxID=2039626 RepID=UPI00335C40FC
MATTLGINGFGRIGRLVLRSIIERGDTDFEIAGINDLTPAATLAHLLKYDSVHGTLDTEVSHTDDSITVGDITFPVFNEKDPANLPWGDVGCDIVVESTGLFRTREAAGKHLEAGAKQVVISAPAKSEVDATVVLGVNDEILTGDEKIVSNASCTTNCLAPLAKVLDEAFGLKHGLMTTIHAYTSSQNIVDGPHSDLRRARTAAASIIPTSTGAAKAVGLVLPELDGKLDGMAMRVPIPNGSITDLTVHVEKEASVEAVDAAFKAAAEGAMKGVLEYNEAPIVSADIIHNPHSCIYDAPSTMVTGEMIKVTGWYDNEWGYASRVVDLAQKISSMS